MKISFVTLGIATALAFSQQTLAHHSFAMFDQTKTVELKGSVQEFQWTNPHAWIEISVPNKAGESERWAIELNSPNNLKREGWSRKSLKPGDNVMITINPLRNGRNGGLFKQVVLPDGKILGETALGAGPVNVPTVDK